MIIIILIIMHILKRMPEMFQLIDKGLDAIQEE